MESLFDASFFDTAPVAKPAEKPSAIVGQLDIFGNVVDLGDVVSSVTGLEEGVDDGSIDIETTEVVEPEIDPLEAAELAGELPGAPIVVDPDLQAEAEALGVVRDLDPGDVLNDPTWEPDEPIDLDEIVAAFDEPQTDLFGEPVSLATAEPGGATLVQGPETDPFGEPISLAAVEQEAEPTHSQETDLFGGPIPSGVAAPAIFATLDGPETDLFGEPISPPGHHDHNEPIETEPDAALASSKAPEAASVAISRPVTELVADQVDADGRRNRSVDALWELVIGQGSTVETLRSAAQQPVHAYLFVGPPGAGKVRAALAFAAAVLCPRGGCAECDICSRTLNQTHPDLLNVEREGASISVDQAREIIRLALRSPVEGSRKVLVLNDFHLVTNAGPTLLKIIEEPPPSTIFIVLAEQITNELVTIASRCVQMVFAPLSVGAVVEALVASGIEESVAKTAANAAGGRLDRARLLATDPEVANRMAFWQNIPRRLDGTGAAASVVAAEAVGGRCGRCGATRSPSGRRSCRT
jgi:DNA polymerase III, delta subunit